MALEREELPDRGAREGVVSPRLEVRVQRLPSLKTMPAETYLLPGEDRASTPAGMWPSRLPPHCAP